MKKSLATACVGLAAVFTAVAADAVRPAKADAALSFNYTGTPYTVVQDPTLGTKLTGKATLDVADNYTGLVGADKITAWSLTSGSVTASNSNAALLLGQFNLANGDIIGWGMQGYSAGAQNALYTFNVGFLQGDAVANPFTGKTNLSATSGNWRKETATPVPVPSAAYLLASSLLGLVCLKRRPSASANNCTNG